MKAMTPMASRAENGSILQAALVPDEVAAAGALVAPLTKEVCAAVGTDAARTVVMTVATTTPSEFVDDEIAVEADAEPLEIADEAVAVPELALLAPVDTDPEELADEMALPSELDARVLEAASETDDTEEEELDPVDEVSEASLANPTAAGEYR